MSPQEHRPVFINDAEIERRDAEIVRLRRINDVLARLGVDDAKRIVADAKRIAEDYKRIVDLNKRIADDAKIIANLNEKVDEGAKIIADLNTKIDDDAKIIADLNKKIGDDVQKMDLRELVANSMGNANQAFDRAIRYFLLFS
jgi:hypothetical protein